LIFISAVSQRAAGLTSKIRERDNAIEGGRRKTVTSDLVIERDLKSGLFGMSLGVGYPASIVAQMLARREIVRPGLLNPLAHVPDGRFLDELARRGIPVTETVRWDS
jgi:lysine 6-dehydrogenase